MIDRVHVAIARARCANEQFPLVYLDLDGFNSVNAADGPMTPVRLSR